MAVNSSNSKLEPMSLMSLNVLSNALLIDRVGAGGLATGSTAEEDAAVLGRCGQGVDVSVSRPALVPPQPPCVITDPYRDPNVQTMVLPEWL